MHRNKSHQMTEGQVPVIPMVSAVEGEVMERDRNLSPCHTQPFRTSSPYNTRFCKIPYGQITDPTPAPPLEGRGAGSRHTIPIGYEQQQRYVIKAYDVKPTDAVDAKKEYALVEIGGDSDVTPVTPE